MKKKEFGQRLRIARQAKGLKQKDLASILGYKTSASIYKIEAGRNQPDIETMANLADILSVDLHWLITGEQAPIDQAIVEPALIALAECRNRFVKQLPKMFKEQMRLYEETQLDPQHPAIGKYKMVEEDVQELQQLCALIISASEKLSANAVPESGNSDDPDRQPRSEENKKN